MITAKMEIAIQNIKDGMAKKAILEGQLASEEEGLRAKIALLTEQLGKKTWGTRADLKEAISQLKASKEELVDQWLAPDKQIKDPDGWTFTVKSTHGIEIKDETGLLQVCAVMPTPPLKAKWDNKKLITLLEAGAISPVLAEVTVSHHIAVTQPKE